MSTGNQAPVPGSDAYNQQMAKTGENVAVNTGNATPSAGDGAPAGGEFSGVNSGEKLLAGKFKTVEELEAAFVALQSGEKKPEGEQQQQQQNIDPKDAEKSTVEDAQKMLQDRGLDYGAFQNEYDETGTLSEESYKKLAEAGIPRELVDSYIEGQKALADAVTNTIFNAVGGADSYQQMVQWAAANLSPAEIDAYNRATSMGDPFTAQLAAEGLYRRYTQAVGTRNPMINGTTSATATDIFQSTAQVTEAMRDPRYRNDPAYRRSVAEKIARSNIL